MVLQIHASLEYDLPTTTDLVLQVEAAHLPEQVVSNAVLDLAGHSHFARGPGEDGIGERVILRAAGRLSATYAATVAIERQLADLEALEALPPHLLPAETIGFLFDSPYCPASRFRAVVAAEFGHLGGGAQVAAMRDFVARTIAYVPGSSDGRTTALDTYLARAGVCRDFAHLLVTLARAAEIPARFASVYALGVEPQDFHAVAEVFLGGAWHLVDATGMAEAAGIAKIGVGRDATDVAFLTSFGPVTMVSQSVSVTRG